MCSSIAKCIFMIISILIMIIGAAFLAAGAFITIFRDSDQMKQLFEAAIETAKLAGKEIPEISGDVLKELPFLSESTIALFVVGGILFSIGVLGFCGSCCSCCDIVLKLFVVVMVILMIGEIVVGTMFLVPDSPLHEYVRKNLKDRLAHFDYNEKTKDSYSQSINLINYFFKCCGVDGKSDFIQDLNHDPPYSCIAKQSLPLEYYSTGCYTDLTDLMQEYILYAGLVLAALLSFQLILVILAIIISKKSNKVSPF